MVRKQLGVLLTGVFVLAPFVVTVYAVYVCAQWLARFGGGMVKGMLGREEVPVAIGVLVALVAIYLVGLATHLWAFRWTLGKAERLLERLPGVRTIYDSVRDLLKLFGGASARGMGKVVLYSPPGQSLSVLGILTNEHPAGTAHEGEGQRVSVYVPMAYGLGGAVIYVRREYLKELDMPVEQALKACATAEVGA